jgi:6-pyruvoyl-tetrahydropterin synthase
VRKKLTLEIQITEYLEGNRKVPLEEIVQYLKEATKVSEDKIRFRIGKLIQNKTLQQIEGEISQVSKEKTDQQFDEIFEHGHFTLKKKGSTVSLVSNMSEASLKKNIEEITKILPKMKEEIGEKLEKVESLVLEKFDPLEILSSVSVTNLFCDPETYSESSFQGQQLCPEIVQSIILKNEIQKYEKKGITENISEVEKLVKEIAKKLPTYYLNEAIAKSKASQIEGEVYLHLINDFLIVRGDAYPQQYEEISLGLFSRIDNCLDKKGFTIREYWTLTNEIQNHSNQEFNCAIQPLNRIKEIQKDIIQYSNKEIRNGTSPNIIREKYNTAFPEKIHELGENYSHLKDSFSKKIFEIPIGKKINKNLLNLLSMKLGDNSKWQHPLDKSDIPIKPVINLDDKYYCFLTQHLVRNSIQIIESLLTKAEKDALNYSNIKGDYFEEKSLLLLEKLIGGKVYPKLKYQKDKEIDGIILTEDYAFLIEIKGKKKRIIAGVQDILSLTKEDIKSSINMAFEQTKRAQDYLESQTEVEFKDKDGNAVLRINKKTLKKIYLINVSLESFSKLSLNINFVKRWDPDLFKGNYYPWIVTIYDLMVFCDLLCDQKEAFINYLNSRIQVAQTETIGASDELDFLGYFLEKGNLNVMPEIKPTGPCLIEIRGFSEKIDRWYSFKRGEIKSAEKPIMRKRA